MKTLPKGVLNGLSPLEREEIAMQLSVGMEDLKAAMEDAYFEYLDLRHTLDYVLWGKVTSSSLSQLTE